MKGSASAAAAWRVDRLAGELGQRLLRIVARARTAPVGREVQVPQAQSRWLGELGAVRLEPALQLVGRRLARRGHVLGQELHLLRHAALDDLVVLVEAHRQRLAVEDFLLDLGLDQPLQFLRRRRSAPLRLEQLGQLVDLVERKPDLLRRRHRRRLPGRRQAVQAEQQRADQQEVQQRLTQQTCHGARPVIGASAAGHGACAAAPAAPPAGLCRR